MRGQLAALSSVGLLLSGLASAPQVAVADATSVPRPDHVVVVVLENHSSAQIVGNPAAPYLTALAANGALMTQSYAVAHPSEPNYLALFSGSTQGITDDSCPHSFTTPDLGDSLIAAGDSFATYSEDLPSAGFVGCTSGKYVRKHNASVNFPSLPGSTNVAMTAFPTDFTTLPTVSYVVPNLTHDMHDGTVAQGDLWVQDHLGPYVTWARQHNSLLLVTFDEDDNASANQITTIVAGAGVVPGLYSQPVTHYNVLRTIEDAYGLAPIGASATAAPILAIWGTPANQPPTAAFSATSTGLTTIFDASSSTDADGSIGAYTWDFGDGAKGIGATATHAYAVPGSYLVTLTVTDNSGAPDTKTVLLPVTSLTAVDSFARAVANGWGPADSGGPWTVSGAATTYAVAGGVGRMVAAAGSGPSAYLNGVSTTDADVQVTLSADKVPTGSGLFVSVIGRRVVGVGDYRVKVRFLNNGKVSLTPERVASTGTETLLGPETAVPGLALVAGDQIRLRLQVTGATATTVRAQAWRAGSAPPAGWLVSATDTATALQVAGTVGVYAYLSTSATNGPISVSFDDFAAGPTNQAPTAVMTPSCSGLDCTFDASSSIDPDGTIASYAWGFGDGSTGSGPSASHSYLNPGMYSVTLTVTDNLGASSTTTTSVAVGVQPDQPPVAAIATPTCTGLSCSFDGSLSSDPDGVIAGYAWTFGDSVGTATGSATTYVYPTAGTYPVTLNVTDNLGAAGAATISVTVAPLLWAQDAFSRTTTTGWGTADLGGAWSSTSASPFAVAGGTGIVTLKTAGTSPVIYIAGVSSANTDTQVTVTTDKAPTGIGIWTNVVGRRVVGVGEYRAKVRLLPTGAVSLAFALVSPAGAETSLRSEVTVAGLTYTPGTLLRIRFQATGTSPTTLRAKVWKVGSSEPTDWTSSVLDATPGLQAAGSVGVMAYLSSSATNAPVAAKFDDFQAGPAT